MQDENDFIAHRQVDPARYYEAQPVIRYSPSTRRWFVFSPELIDRILQDQNFEVPSYDRSALAKRFGIPNAMTKAINDTLPLSTEGHAHKLRRKRVARIISLHSEDAKSCFSDEFNRRISGIRNERRGAEFCLLNDLLLHPMRAALFSGRYQFSFGTLPRAFPASVL